MITVVLNFQSWEIDLYSNTKEEFNLQDEEWCLCERISNKYDNYSIEWMMIDKDSIRVNHCDKPAVLTMSADHCIINQVSYDK